MFINTKILFLICVVVSISVAGCFIGFSEWAKSVKQNKVLRTSLNTYKRENELYYAREQSSKIIAQKIYKRRFDKNLSVLSDGLNKE